MKRRPAILSLAAAGAAVIAALLLLLPRGRAPAGPPGRTAAGTATVRSPTTSSERLEPTGPSPTTPATPGEAPGEAMAPAGTLLQARWGSGKGELGRSRPSEANPEIPTSFTLDPAGRLIVLDKVNGRIVRYDRSGKELPAIPVTQRSPQELVATPDGHLLVMDRLADKTVAILDDEGNLKGELPIVGKGIEQGGSATGLFYDSGGVYVESEHSQVVRIGGLDGIPDPERPELDGRPSRDGKSLLSARLVDRAAGRFMVRVVDRASGSLRHQKQVVLGARILSLVLLDSDPRGGIYVGAHVGEEVEPGRMLGEAVQVVCLGAQLDVRGQASLPPNTLPEETFRDLTVLDDGSIAYMHSTEGGVTVRTYRCS